MTERLKQPHRSGNRAAPRRAFRPAPRDPLEEPTILGFPAEVVEDTGPADLPMGTGPADSAPPEVPWSAAAPADSPSQTALTVLRRPEAFGAGALVLAGVAANVSLSLSWSPGEGPTGLSLVQRGGEALDAGLAASARSEVWEPIVVVSSGGLLVLLGFLLLVPARTHRLVGLLALVVSLAATAAALFIVSEAGWRLDRFGPGTWCAVAVPALGLLGSLKAMLTAPRVTLDGAQQARSPTVT
ncbi:MAG TPA: hypothetical protein VGB58_00265 [Blastococcus sp.]|jgi:hypothetical protein